MKNLLENIIKSEKTIYVSLLVAIVCVFGVGYFIGHLQNESQETQKTIETAMQEVNQENTDSLIDMKDIASIETTNAGILFKFNDGTGYYYDYKEHNQELKTIDLFQQGVEEGKQLGLNQALEMLSFYNPDDPNYHDVVVGTNLKITEVKPFLDKLKFNN